MSYYLTNDELYHYGVLGQKWGIRRFQNADGSLTAEGKERYRTDKVLNNVGRAILNGGLGQRMAVNLNKGYRTDKKEIKKLYKEKKQKIKNSSDSKEKKAEKLKSLKSDYKKTKGEARVAAAEANYNWQSKAMNQKIQTQNLGKQFLKSTLMGGYGHKLYDQVTAETGDRVSGAVIGLIGQALNTPLYGLVSTADYAYNKINSNK